MELSKRMLSVASFVPLGSSVCDVGCDHGFVSIYLIQQGICPKVIASDIRKGPLQRAKEHITQAGLSAYIEPRLSDGLKQIGLGETDGMIAAGMGGRLMAGILMDSLEKAQHMDFLVLQPQSELSYFRRFLREQGFRIENEDMVLEDGKYYPVLFVKMREMSGKKTVSLQKEIYPANVAEGVTYSPDYMQSLEDEFGPCLIEKRHEVLLSYLDFWEKHQEKILESVGQHRERTSQVEEEIRRIQDVRSLMR